MTYDEFRQFLGTTRSFRRSLDPFIPIPLSLEDPGVQELRPDSTVPSVEKTLVGFGRGLGKETVTYFERLFRRESLTSEVEGESDMFKSPRLTVCRPLTPSPVPTPVPSSIPSPVPSPVPVTRTGAKKVEMQMGGEEGGVRENEEDEEERGRERGRKRVAGKDEVQFEVDRLFNCPPKGYCEPEHYSVSNINDTRGVEGEDSNTRNIDKNESKKREGGKGDVGVRSEMPGTGLRMRVWSRSNSPSALSDRDRMEGMNDVRSL